MPDTVSDLARRLAENAEAVCRHYLSNGRRAGGYWLAGDVQNSPGRSLYVRLRGPTSGKGAAGKWTDAATGEHGDLLDLIMASQHLHGGGPFGQSSTRCARGTLLPSALDEARRFLGLAQPHARPPSPPCAGILSAGAGETLVHSAPAHSAPTHSAVAGSPEAVQRLFAMARPIAGTLADAYLRGRGIELPPHDTLALRFHPRCFYRPDESGGQQGSARAARGRLAGGSVPVARTAWPAMVAAVADRDGEITGLQRTYLDPGLDPAGSGKAPVPTPRRAMGHLLGHAVRFGAACDTMVAGEGIETMLSLRCVLPTMPVAAALSAGHLAALLFPAGLRRLYIARDRDRAGRCAAERLMARTQEARIEAIVLTPSLDDFNDDLRQLGADALAGTVRGQLAPEDVGRFWRPPKRGWRTR